MKKWFARFGVDRVVELDWWEEQYFVEHLKVVATPCNHWSKRHLFWKNDTLWNSYAVIGNNRRVFFAGDTSYCNVFKRVGNKQKKNKTKQHMDSH
jgi:N-acyl-phosphatidylethanolamine-hydrolysing phospholipase D